MVSGRRADKPTPCVVNLNVSIQRLRINSLRSPQDKHDVCREFRPGDMVSFRGEPKSLGTVISVTSEKHAYEECNVLWSREPFLDVQIQIENITAKSRQLKTAWSMSRDEDLEVMHGHIKDPDTK